MQIQALVDQMKNDPMLVERMKADPVGAIQHEAAGSVLASDVLVYRIVVSSLGLGVLISLVGALVLSGLGQETPAVVTALGSACVGALAGLLAPSPRS